MLRSVLVITALWSVVGCKDSPEEELDCEEGTHEEDGECVADSSDTGDTGVVDEATEGLAPGECSDGLDNDQDGAIDCADPDCQANPECDGMGPGGGGGGGGGPGNASAIVQVATNFQQSCSLNAGGDVNCWGYNYGNYSYLDYEFTQIDGHYNQFCGVTVSGDAICWGYDIWGSTLTAPETRFKSVAAGASTVCGVTESDTVECWGNDSYGQVSYRPTSTVKQVEMGYYHGCAITMDDALSCWGNYSSSQTSIQAPAGSYQDLDSTWWSTCALDDGGTAWCWGDYDSVAHGLTAIGVGTNYACGIQSDSTLSCWGTGGIFDQSEKSERALPPEGEFTQLSTSSYHACALSVDGEVECWGSNDYGQSSPP